MNVTCQGPEAPVTPVTLVPTVDVETLRGMLEGHDPVTILDVRPQAGADARACANRALHSPGHTLESMSYLVDEPWLLTGDTLFLPGVGRPDLPATPPNHHTIVDFNEAGELPAGDPTDLEAGANRCAVS